MAAGAAPAAMPRTAASAVSYFFAASAARSSRFPSLVVSSCSLTQSGRTPQPVVSGGEPVQIRLRATDSPSVAGQALGLLPGVGKPPFKTWRYEVKTSGLQQVELKTLGARQPGQYRLKVKSKGWFTAADANQPYEQTTFEVAVGTQCFSTAATKKTD